MEQLENELLCLQLAPELGGKIVQLTDRRSQRAWLFQHPRLSRKLPGEAELDAPDVYTRLADFGGWDECCPTVAASTYPWMPYEGAPLADHGDCWYQVPTIAQSNDWIEYCWRLRALPVTLCRRMWLSPDQPRLDMSYALRSQGDESIALLWSAHPLLAIEAGMRLELPPETRLRIVSDDSALGAIGHEFTWPWAGDVDLSRLRPDAGWHAKLFSEPLNPGWVALVAPDGSRLQISWESDTPLEELPLRLALWLNYGSWSGDDGAALQNVGLKPCLGMPDALHEATAAGTAFVLPPGASYQWRLSVTLN